MMYVVKSLLFKLAINPTAWIASGLVPGTGRLDIDTSDSGDGLVRTYRLRATLSRDKRAGADILTEDMMVRVILDDGENIIFGSQELPVRLSISGSDPLSVSCDWQDSI
jgi:hypothetical protein